MASEKTRRRRAKTRRLAEQGVSQRKIAEELGVSIATVNKDIHLDRPKPASTNPAGPGNLRSLTYGGRSEQLVKPVRERHADALRADFPALDHRRLAILSDRLARIEIASKWVDDNGVVRDQEGEVFPAIKELEKWQTRAEVVLKEIAEEYKAGQKYQGLAEYMNGNGDDG